MALFNRVRELPQLSERLESQLETPHVVAQNIYKSAGATDDEIALMYQEFLNDGIKTPVVIMGEALEGQFILNSIKALSKNHPRESRSIDEAIDSGREVTWQNCAAILAETYGPAFVPDTMSNFYSSMSGQMSDIADQQLQEWRTG